jgi:uncharacterized repeat protein (TIGR03803 family)
MLKMVLMTALLVTVAGSGVVLDRAVAKVDPEVVLYSFRGVSGSDGAQPTRALLRDREGALYGTTAFGGTGGAPGNGTVFELVHRKTGGFGERILYRFRGLAQGDGAQAEATLASDRTGALYGTTVYGGSSLAGAAGGGIVFKLTPAAGSNTSTYTESVLYRFTGGSHNDGSQPYAGVIEDASGALYGTTAFGGNGGGVVFKLSPTSGGYRERIIYRFKGISSGDGASPYSRLIADETGALYGTTAFGGSPLFGSQGGGTVFKLTPTPTGYVEHVLYRFRGAANGDGAVPVASLAVEHGALYGTTEFGGSLAAGDQGKGGGTVFKLTPTRSGYTESVIYEFQGPANADGYFPQCTPIDGESGTLYGTASFGGSGGFGIVFKLTPAHSGYTEAVLFRFQGLARGDGAQPYSSLFVGEFGALTGTTLNGGQGDGTVFRIEP